MLREVEVDLKYSPMRKEKNHKTTYMLNKEWYCDICKTGRNYTLAGKSCHLKTKKHIKNVHEINIKEVRNEITRILNP